MNMEKCKYLLFCGTLALWMAGGFQQVYAGINACHLLSWLLHCRRHSFGVGGFEFFFWHEFKSLVNYLCCVSNYSIKC